MFIALPSPEMTLQFRLDEIAAQEQAWIAEGYCVGEFVKDIKFWAERGIYTARDLDEMLDLEHKKEERKSQMSGYDEDYERWLDERESDPVYIAECEAERAAYEARLRDMDEFMAVPTFAETAFYRTCAAHQDGWQ